MKMAQPVSFSPLRASQAVAPAAPVRNDPHKMPEVKASVPVARLTILARELAKQEPPVDHARIAQLRQAIASGGYRPEARAIADAMLHQFGWTGA